MFASTAGNVAGAFSGGFGARLVPSSLDLAAANSSSPSAPRRDYGPVSARLASASQPARRRGLVAGEGKAALAGRFAQAIEVGERPSGAQDNARQRRRGQIYGQARLESEALVKAAQEHAASGKEDAVTGDVSCQLGGRLLERVLDGVDDFTQRTLDRRPYLTAA